MDKRSEVIILRVTPEEKALMQQKQELAGITNLSAYIRKIAIDGYVIQLHFPELKEMVSLLRYSSNIKDYSRQLSTAGKYRAVTEFTVSGSQSETFTLYSEATY